MSPAELDLARELVSRSWWEWRPGMRAVSPDLPRDWVRIADLPDPRPAHWRPWVPTGWVPDLRDSATQGCLIGLLLDGTSADVRLTWTRGVLDLPKRSLEVRWMGWTWRGDPVQILARALLAVRS